MTIVIDENSYVDIAGADAYFLTRYGYDQWAPLDDAAKEQALVSATAYLNSLCEWDGYPVDPEQPLAFPRNPNANPTPQAIKDAQCEIAYGMVLSGSASDSGSTEDVLTKLKAGDVELEFKGDVNPTSSLTSDYTKSLLRQYGTCHFSGAKSRIVDVWRA